MVLDSQQSLCGGTTLVLLVSELAAAIASDSAQHVAHGGLHATDVQKITQVSNRLLVGVSGVCAATAGSGQPAIDLQDSIPRLLAEHAWDGSAAAIEAVHDALGAEIAVLEARTFPGPPDHALTPQITVAIAGVSNQNGPFGTLQRYPGRYVPEGIGHRLLFERSDPELLLPRSGRLHAMVDTRLPDVQRAAMACLRVCSGMLPADTRLDGEMLRTLAGHIVKFTMELDPHIAGAIVAYAVAQDDQG